MSARLRLRFAAPIAAFVLASACQEADVGQACPMNVLYADGSPVDEAGTGCSADRSDFFRSGAIECENLVCLRSVTGPCPGGTSAPFLSRSYCSKACVSDDDCFTSETGLVCRRVLLDPSFVASLPDGGAPWLPAALASSYCATPSLQ